MFLFLLFIVFPQDLVKTVFILNNIQRFKFLL